MLFNLFHLENNSNVSSESKLHSVETFCSLNSHLPKIYQSFLMSATLTEDVQALKELLLHNPVTSSSHPHIHGFKSVKLLLRTPR